MRKLILAVLLLFMLQRLPAAVLDFRGAVIVLPRAPSSTERVAAQMLSEEIEKRTQLRLKIGDPAAGQPAIYLGRAGQLGPLRNAVLTPGKPESFAITTSNSGPPTLLVWGSDDRGVIFGAGYLLRQFHMSKQRLALDGPLNHSSSPVVQIRGHQLGYRPKTNAYDAWTVPMWDQYIRELAIFGTNTVELVPPRSDDAPDSPHFSLPPIEMMTEMSRIADKYSLDVSIWYPAMDKDYSDPKIVDFALHEWGEVFKRLPRINAIFVPGGDPGHTQPRYLMALLEKQAENLHRYHPNAQVWMSPQSFSKDWMEEFYGIMDTGPRWLKGIVYGPQTMYSLPEVRARVPKRYPFRLYPDITHSVHSQFPVPAWDAAFAATEGREGINPRPLGEAVIFHKYSNLADGFVTYSEGCNDDVNKFIWSGLGWNPAADVRTLLTEYSRFFIADEMADSFTDGLFALERNWRGPLIENAGVDATLLHFEQLERRARPQTKLSWRFQQAIYRANYDAYIRARLLSETQQESAALDELRKAQQTGSSTAMERAEAALDAKTLPESARQLRSRVFEMAEALFQSIHMQLSVPRYQAISLGRGANLDAVDFALNNRVWMKQRFSGVRRLPTEPQRIDALNTMAHWTDPGPGGFYDDLGNLAHQPHLLPGEGFNSDPDFLHSALTGFGGRTAEQGWRVSWFDDAESLYDEPLRMRYDNLDKTAKYKIRVTYGGDMPNVPIRLVANGHIEIHGFRKKDNPPRPAEFDLPPAATANGTLQLEWTRPPGLGGNGRGCQVSEVWLIRIAL